MADPASLEKDAVNFATRAVKCDQEGIFDTAIFYYTEASQALLGVSMIKRANATQYIQKSNEYINRAEQLKIVTAQHTTAYVAPKKTQEQLDTERGKFLLEQAFEVDENGSGDEALELYKEAADIFIKLRRNSSDRDFVEKITNLATQAIQRAEVLSNQQPNTSKPLSPTPSRTGLSKPTLVDAQSRAIRPLGDDLRDDTGPITKPAPQRSRHQIAATSGGASYTKEEIQVLKTTSVINGREFVPFMSVDMKEKFAYPMPYSDKEGKLALAPRQKTRIDTWKRPDEFCENPTMIYAVSSFSIKQTIVSDASFVASLAVSAQYERRFKKKLVTSIIYPQNRQGEPQFNPCGKYMVKLNINGVPRKVVIDDFLPVAWDGQLLCSYSNNRNELWVSLLEKAYMKVMGGYDFPGSNSNIDLNALTGWIPERVAIRPGSRDFDGNKEFNKIIQRFHKGDCLVTVATGWIPAGDADRAGLVPMHAYAMLDIRETQGHRLFMLKNPWGHLRWKGNFSERDVDHWTQALCKELNYDPNSAQQFDNGIFWIDLDCVIKYFDVIYLNWNPDLFTHTTCMHHTWTATDGPKTDNYNIGDNPQYRLEVKAPGPSAVWILLTRHITDKDDFADNKEFITVLVYKTNGKRIFYPYDPLPHKDGVRINSPHYLCKMVEEEGTNLYTLVVSQYEKSNTIYYTLRVYSTCEFSLNKISEPYVAKYLKRITGEWKGESAGGCANFPETHKNNPVYQFTIDNDMTTNHVLVELRGPKQYSVGFDVTCIKENVQLPSGPFTKKTSGDYRQGFCVLELDNLCGGIYNIKTCTFKPGKEAPFLLTVRSSAPINIAQVV